MTVPSKLERTWSQGTTCVVLATGPSLTREDVDYVRRFHNQGVRVIAVNDAYKLAPWADVLYACDPPWWRLHRQGIHDAGVTGRQVTCCENEFPDIECLNITGNFGYDPDPRNIRTGYNSGYQAVHCAAHLGARNIVLLGFNFSKIWKPAAAARSGISSGTTRPP